MRGHRSGRVGRVSARGQEFRATALCRWGGNVDRSATLATGPIAVNPHRPNHLVVSRLGAIPAAAGWSSMAALSQTLH